MDNVTFGIRLSAPLVALKNINLLNINELSLNT